MRITSSLLPAGQAVISIVYETMLDECLSGKEIEIRCRQFRNPIVPDKTGGYGITIMDENIPKKPIESTEEDVFMETSDYEPGLIPATVFKINPTNP